MKRLRQFLACAALAILAGCGAGIGSGGTGISPGGVGSGGTGFTMGAAVLSNGLVVNGTRFDLSQARLELEDAETLQPGMTVRVLGQVSTDRTQGTATAVISAADLRGPIGAVDPVAGTFSMLGVTVTTDAGTVYAGVGGVADLRAGGGVVVYGLPVAGGVLRATRIERTTTPGAAVLTGVLQDWDPQGRSFRIGATAVSYAAGRLDLELANGVAVRVRGTVAGDTGLLVADRVQSWYDVPPQAPDVTLAGVIGNYVAPDTFTLGGVPVRAGSAPVTGGTLGNGVRIQATGSMINGVLLASSIRVISAPPNNGSGSGSGGGDGSGGGNPGGGSSGGGNPGGGGSGGGNPGGGGSGGGNPGGGGSGGGDPGGGDPGGGGSGGGDPGGGGSGGGNPGGGGSGGGNPGGGGSGGGNPGGGGSGGGNPGGGGSGGGNPGGGNGNGSGNNGNGNGGGNSGNGNGSGNNGHGNGNAPPLPFDAGTPS
jgi:hypothetical protein